MQFVSRLSGFHIFASNKDTKSRFKHWVSDKCWEDIKVTYTCVNPPEIQRVLAASIDEKELRSQFGIRTGAFVVLCVGQFIDRKGRWVFLDAAEIIGNDDSEVVFVWLTPATPDS